MKKFSCVVFAANSFATLAQSLTLAFNKPVSGDVYLASGFDSTAAINKTIGTGKLWNFSTFTANTQTSNATYTTASSGINSSSFPGATVASFDPTDPNTSYQYYKTNGSNFEFMGVADNTPSTVSFSNTGIEFIYPLSYGSTYSDTYGGSGTYSTSAATYAGTLNVLGAGTGTIMLPGNTTLANCLQVVSNRTINLDIGGGLTFTVVSKTYDYYHSSQKFPAISIVYSNSQSPFGPSSNFVTWVNKAFVSGLKENEPDNAISLYPNPSTDRLSFNFKTAKTGQKALIQITDASGKTVKKMTVSLSEINALDINDLQPGFYILTVSEEGKNHYSRFIKQ